MLLGPGSKRRNGKIVNKYVNYGRKGYHKTVGGRRPLKSETGTRGEKETRVKNVWGDDAYRTQGNSM